MEFDWTVYKVLHQQNMGKFKIGQQVRYVGHFEWAKGEIFTVAASNNGAGEPGLESTEYCLEKFPYLVWENEIEAVEEKN